MFWLKHLRYVSLHYNSVEMFLVDIRILRDLVNVILSVIRRTNELEHLLPLCVVSGGLIDISRLIRLYDIIKK